MRKTEGEKKLFTLKVRTGNVLWQNKCIYLTNDHNKFFEFLQCLN